MINKMKYNKEKCNGCLTNDVCDDCPENIEKIVEILIQAKNAYYNDEPIMSDQEFDQLEDDLRKLDPENSYFSVVGIATTGNKIKHKYPMLSCQKVKNINELEKWFQKTFNNRYEFCITPKLDGLSYSAKYKNKKLQYLVTRGDGKRGQDITNKANYINDINKEINDSSEIEIRGELIIEKQHSDYFNNKPLRNICVGLINRKDDFEDLKYVRAVAYNVLGTNFITEIDKYEFLKINKWNNIIKFDIINTLREIKIMYSDWEKCLRDEYEYEVDGLVLTVNDNIIQKNYVGRAEYHYDYQIALKFTSESKKTKLLDINWNVSRHGNIIPTAIFEPIFIQGRKIKQASLSNYENVIRMKLEMNDEILVSLSNDVIPYIEENITKGIKQR